MYNSHIKRLFADIKMPHAAGTLCVFCVSVKGYCSAGAFTSPS